MTKPIIAAFTVGINSDGTLFTEPLPEGENIQRVATTYDIYQCSQQLAKDVEEHLLAERVAQAVAAALKPIEEPGTAEKLRNALLERELKFPPQH